MKPLSLLLNTTGINIDRQKQLTLPTSCKSSSPSKPAHHTELRLGLLFQHNQSLVSTSHQMELKKIPKQLHCGRSCLGMPETAHIHFTKQTSSTTQFTIIS